jgi:hypothetical protein
MDTFGWQLADEPSHRRHIEAGAGGGDSRSLAAGVTGNGIYSGDGALGD